MIKVAINLIPTLPRAFAGGGTMAQDPLLLIQCHRRHIFSLQIKKKQEPKEL